MTLSQHIYEEVSKEAPSCLMKPDREYSITELIRLLFHPRGIEHAITSGFPTMQLLDLYEDELINEPIRLLHGEQDNVYLSGGRHLFAGDGLLFIDVIGSEDGLTTLVFLHGAKATIWARKYATVKVYADASSSVDIINEDNTALIL